MNFHGDSKFIELKQRRSVRRFVATDDDVVKMCSQSRKPEVEAADLRAPSGGLIGLFNNLANGKLAKCVASQVEISADNGKPEENREYCECPTDYPPHSHHYS